MTSQCATCGAPCSRQHNRCRACYKAERTVSDKTCAICGAPIIGFYAAHCRKCSQSLRRGCELAARLTPDEKRAMAKAAVQGLIAKGYVKVRFLQRRKSR